MNRADLRYFDALRLARDLESQDGNAQTSLRITLGGNANLDFMIPGLRLELFAEGFASDASSSAYGNWISATFENDNADAWVIWISAMGASAGGTARSEIDVGAISAAIERLVQRATKVVLILPEPLALEDDPFSPYVSWRTGLAEAIRTAAPAAAVVLSVDHLVRRMGMSTWTATRYWEQAKAPCHPDAMTAVGTEVATVLSRLLRPRVKAIALDLDDTIWGGLVGEVGPAGLDLDANGTGRPYLEMQRFVADLSERGVAIGVVSKNDESEARRPFAERSEMVLSLDRFASFDVSWAPKAEAIARLATKLNVGIDTVCLIDDSPMEREAARHMLPGLIVPELPAPPAERVGYLVRSRLFMAPQVSDEDRLRGAFYNRPQEPAGEDVDAYLDGLDMVLEARPVEQDNFDRVLSLLHKTNQYNLTLWRPSPVELRTFVSDSDHYAYAFRLTDRLGDAGIIAVLLAAADERVCRLVAWVMSCRVFTRGVEWAVAEHLSRWLASRSVNRVEAPYVRGPRNGLLEDVLASLGLAPSDGAGEDPLFVGDHLQPPRHHLKISS